MASPEQARATQIRNIESKLGRELDVIRAEVAASGKVKHGEIRSWLSERFGLGYGDANTLAHFAAPDRANPTTVPSESEDAVAEIYSSRKAHLRPIHDALIAAMKPWGDFEMAPKKGYVSFRRRKQFAMLRPKNAERAELGINLTERVASARVVAQKPGATCPHVVALSHTSEVDDELLALLQRAFDAQVGMSLAERAGHLRAAMIFEPSMVAPPPPLARLSRLDPIGMPRTTGKLLEGQRRFVVIRIINIMELTSGTHGLAEAVDPTGVSVSLQMSKSSAMPSKAGSIPAGSWALSVS